jgi:hypothetical protein
VHRVKRGRIDEGYAIVDHLDVEGFFRLRCSRSRPAHERFAKMSRAWC